MEGYALCKRYGRYYQETFIKLWLHRDKLGIIENLGGYIYRTAARTTLNHLRAALNRDKKMIELGLLSRPSAEQSAPTPLDLVSANKVRELIRTAVDQLTPQQQKIYSLNREVGLKPAAIAAELNLSVSTVKNHLSDALKQIGAYIIRSGYDLSAIFYALILLS